MDYFWDQLPRLGCSPGTTDGLNGLMSTGVMALLVVGIIVIAVGIVWQIPQAWRQVLAEKSEEHLENPVVSGGSHRSSPPDDVAPTSDL